METIVYYGSLAHVRGKRGSRFIVKPWVRAYMPYADAESGRTSVDIIKSGGYKISGLEIESVPCKLSHLLFHYNPNTR